MLLKSSEIKSSSDGGQYSEVDMHPANDSGTPYSIC